MTSRRHNRDSGFCIFEIHGNMVLLPTNYQRRILALLLAGIILAAGYILIDNEASENAVAAVEESNR